MIAAGWTPALSRPPSGSPLTPSRGPAAHADVRVANLSLILRCLQGAPPLSRTQIAGRTGLAKATVSALVGELVSRGLVSESSPASSGAVGRPSSPLSINPLGAASIGIEIGPETLMLTSIDLSGTIIDQGVRLLGTNSPGPAHVIEKAGTVLTEEIVRLERMGTRVAGIMIAQPGVLDYERGAVIYSSVMGWHDVPIIEGVSSVLQRRLAGRPAPPVGMEHDAKLAAVASYRDYADEGVRDLLYLSGGTGIGAGIITDGRLLRGWHGVTGEIGHMPIEPDGLMCRCGRRGCLETRVGLDAVAGAPTGDIHPDGTGKTITERVHRLRRRLETGDTALGERLDRAGQALATGLSILVDILNPQVIILSGYLTSFPEVFVDRSRRVLEDRRLDHRLQARIEPSVLNEQAPSTGAALVPLEDVLANPTLMPVHRSP